MHTIESILTMKSTDETNLLNRFLILQYSKINFEEKFNRKVEILI